MAKLNKEQIDFLFNPDTPTAVRKYACELSFPAFISYYFSDFFTYQFAPFHYQFFDDCQDLASGKIKRAAWIGFRECAKTSIAKLFLVWLIVYKKKKYINVDSYDKENSERLLFDVVLSLQTNQRLINDFGQVYNRKRTDDEATIRRVSNFITNNGVRVEAHSTQESIRGRVHLAQRPDFILFDDIETSKTSDSRPTTEKIIDHVDEAKTGLSVDGCELYLGNYIIEEGVVGYVMRSIENSAGRVRFIPVVNKLDEIAWTDKYVHTDAEALEENKNRTKEKQVVSLEAKKRELNAGGRRVYEVEMLEDPIAAGSPFFDRKVIDRLITLSTKADEDKAGFLLWAKYNPSHRYAIGADTSMGGGRDSNTSLLIDFSTIPARHVGTYENNLIAPDIFAHELKREGNMFGTCLLAPESNAESGGSCVTALKLIYPIDKIFRPRQIGKVITATEKVRDRMGWETTASSKPEMLFRLKAAIESGQLMTEDIRVLKELRAYLHSDIQNPSPETRHFDLLMAFAIAWSMKDYAEAPVTTATYEQPPYEQPHQE